MKKKKFSGKFSESVKFAKNSYAYGDLCLNSLQKHIPFDIRNQYTYFADHQRNIPIICQEEKHRGNDYNEWNRFVICQHATK